MLKLLVFSIYDGAAEAFLAPIFELTRGMAVRSFSDAVNEEGHQFGRHAADYTLFHIGYFHQSSGELEAITPDSMGNALQYVVNAKSGVDDLAFAPEVL